jgi:NDP-hexose 2,3-enoyl reductase
MEYTNLGRTGLSVSRLCLGTMNFGPQTTEQDSFAIMDRALEHGINFFDTANVYGWKLGEGITEQIIGRWLAQGDGRREKVVLATKAYGKMSDWPNGQGLSARHLIRECEASLAACRPTSSTCTRCTTSPGPRRGRRSGRRWRPWSPRQGRVRGVVNFAGWHLVQAQEAAAGGLSRARLGAMHHNLLTRFVELEVVPAALQYGISIIRGRRCTWPPVWRAAQALPPVPADEPSRAGIGRSGGEAARDRGVRKACALDRGGAGRCRAGLLLSRPG